MSYNVRADRIAQDIDDDVQKTILDFLKTYDFQYATCIDDKEALRDLFIEHFRDRHNLAWLKQRLYKLASIEGKNLRGIASCAWTETNRLHTMGLGRVILSKGMTRCTTVHTYGRPKSMTDVCTRNLEGKEFDIQEILNNTFPRTLKETTRTDIPMIPQHLNCRHVMAPVQKERQLITTPA